MTPPSAKKDGVPDRMAARLEALAAPGLNPRQAEAAALFARLDSGEERVATRAERALARLGPWAAREALTRLPGASPPARGRLCRVVGRVARQTPEPALSDALTALLDDPDPRTRRYAIRGLGRLALPGLEEALLRRWEREPALEQRRALAVALGQTGGPRALAALGAEESDDPELRRVVTEARERLERARRRDAPSRIDPARASSRPLPVLLHCRAGLEPILAEELGSHLRPRRQSPGVLQARLSGALTELLRPRTLLRFTFPLPPETPGTDQDPEAVARALCSPIALGILRAFTDGVIRYRLEWADAGHRRAATLRCARLVARACPELQNDPRQSTWEVIVHRRQDRLRIELWPRSLEDPRFCYRQQDVPAASHPTLAAALARLAGIWPDDVVWDPFVGSGTELVERGLRGPYRRLVGTDLDPRAVTAAQTNLSAAGLTRWEIERGDALAVEPPAGLTLLITNPPMGRRVADRAAIPPLLGELLRRVAPRLQPGGRLIWISPLFQATVDMARQAGLQLSRRLTVDMGGFTAEIQCFAKHA